MSKSSDYFDNERYAELVERYQRVKLAFDVKTVEREILLASANLRRFRRLRNGGSDRDAKLLRLESELGPLTAHYNALRDELAQGIYAVARNYAKSYPPFRKRRDDIDDFIQEAVMYGLKAVCRFERERATSLLSFLTSCCRFTWLPMLRRERQHAEKLQEYAAERDSESYRDRGRRRRPNRVDSSQMTYEGEDSLFYG